VIIMADVFKPTYKKPVPEGEKIHKEKMDGKWKRYIKLKDSRGREIKGYITEDGAGYLHPLKNWAGYYKDYHGKRRKISLCTDKLSSISALNCLNDLIELLRAGRSVPRLQELPPLIHRAAIKALEASGQITKMLQLGRKPISEHLENYLTHLESKGTTAKHRKEVRRYVEAIANTCGFRTLDDVEITPVEDLVNAKKAEGLSARTRNVYVDRFRYFLAWAKKRHIIEVNPFEGWERLNEKANRVREARALTEDEISRLLDAAHRRPLENRLRLGYKFKQATLDKLIRKGEKHRLFYSLLLYTGLRVNEVRQLLWSDVNIDDDRPHLRVRAKMSKNSKETTLPLHPWLISLLKDWKAKNPGIGAARPIVHVPSSLFGILKRDLEFAGIPKTDESGRVVHLHAQRHTFVSMLAHKGVQPHIVQKLARHAKMDMTMEVYTHIYHGEKDLAVGMLPTPQAVVSQNQATGTGDCAGAVDSPKNAHVHPHVQNPGLSRISLSSAGTNSEKSPSDDVSPIGSVKSLDGVTLGNANQLLAPLGSDISVCAKSDPKNSTGCQAGRSTWLSTRVSSSLARRCHS
jgi:integrase